MIRKSPPVAPIPAAISGDAPAKRSAEHWFLDAATFAHDGDHEHAVEAALAGIAAIRGTGHA